MKLTLKNAKNPLALFRKVFDEYVIAPLVASQRSILEQHHRNDLAIINAHRACH